MSTTTYNNNNARPLSTDAAVDRFLAHLGSARVQSTRSLRAQVAAMHAGRAARGGPPTPQDALDIAIARGRVQVRRGRSGAASFLVSEEEEE